MVRFYIFNLMMKYFLGLICAFLLQSAIAQDTTFLHLMQKQLDQGKILDVYQQLEKRDPQNKDLDIFLAKMHIALNYHVVKNQYEQFGFVDLQSGQSLTQLRKKSGKYLLYKLKIGPIIDSFIQEMPEEPSLYKAKVDYLYECLLNYSEDFYLTKDKLLQELELAAQKSVDLRTGDYETFFILGYIHLNKNKFEDAQRYFKQSIILNPLYAPVYYNLSYTEFALKNFESSIHYAKMALEMYEDSTQKSDACRMISYGFDYQNQTDSAIVYIEKALEYYPKNFDAIIDYLYIAVRNQLPVAEQLILAAIMIDPTHPEVYNAVINTYYQEGDNYAPVLKVLEYLENMFAQEDLVISNVYFFKGQILFEGSPKEAQVYFQKAKKIFEKIYAPNHEVFQVINQYLNEVIVE